MERRARLRLAIFAIVAVTCALVALQPIGAATTRFFDDDPIAVYPDTQDASGVQAWDIDLLTDLMLNLFTRPGDPAVGVRAQDLNTIDEVPDSSWFTNRVYARPLGIDEVSRGPNVLGPPAQGRWTVVRAKSAGFAPGFTAKDENGVTWFVSFDPVSQPGAATAAVAVATRLFWSLGYYQVETHLARLRPELIDIGEGVTITPRKGHTRPFTMGDVRAVLARAARSEDGSYRVVAGRALPGRPVGGFRYYGTRPDDPNDVIPHEHRRVLRALKVFGAWTNLVDMKAGNTLDTVVTENGRARVVHYLQDVGSTFGAGAQGPRDWDEGWEYVIEFDAFWKRLASFGFYIQPWQTADYRQLDEIGRFEGDAFEPERWRSRVPAAAVLRAREDDTFWAALRVAAFSDEMIRAAVKAGEFSDPEAERLLADVLVTRRDKIARAYLPKINPIVRPALAADGTLSFGNAAVEAGVAQPPREYRAEWFAFDNATGATEAIGKTSGAGPSLPSPTLPAAEGAFVQVDIVAEGGPNAAWSQPVRAWFRRGPAGWNLVGLVRQP